MSLYRTGGSSKEKKLTYVASGFATYDITEAGDYLVVVCASSYSYNGGIRHRVGGVNVSDYTKVFSPKSMIGNPSMYTVTCAVGDQIRVIGKDSVVSESTANGALFKIEEA